MLSALIVIGLTFSNAYVINKELEDNVLENYQELIVMLNAVILDDDMSERDFKIYKDLEQIDYDNEKFVASNQEYIILRFDDILLNFDVSLEKGVIDQNLANVYLEYGLSVASIENIKTSGVLYSIAFIFTLAICLSLYKMKKISFNNTLLNSLSILKIIIMSMVAPAVLLMLISVMFNISGIYTFFVLICLARNFIFMKKFS